MDKAPLEVICAEVNSMRSEFQVLCDRLDDNESVREFLPNWFKSIPANLLAESYGDDRIKASPQYRALGIKVRRVVDWALCPFDQRHLVKSWASVDDADDAMIFLLAIVNSTVEGEDDAHESAVNAYTEARGLAFDLEDDQHADYRADQNRRLFGYAITI